MSRGRVVGLMAFSLVLVVMGAVLEFAVTVTTKGFSIHTIGAILLTVGIVAFVVSLVLLALGANSRTVVQEDVRSVPGAQQRVVEQQDNF